MQQPQQQQHVSFASTCPGAISSLIPRLNGWTDMTREWIQHVFWFNKVNVRKGIDLRSEILRRLDFGDATKPLSATVMGFFVVALASRSHLISVQNPE
jgi:hypothetical protein